MMLDSVDRKIIEATQAGLPLVAAPFAAVSERVGISETEVIERLNDLKQRGVVRRIGAAPNHYRLGMVANGMTVWDVEDTALDRLGEAVGALPFVTHCYRRPRALPDWPYNLFAMVHGKNRDEAMAKRDEIAALLKEACRGGDILFSTRILKKTGLRLRRREG